MSEHYKYNVTGVSKFCKTCNKRTIHRVSVGRVGGCTEQHHAPRRAGCGPLVAADGQNADCQNESSAMGTQRAG